MEIDEAQPAQAAAPAQAGPGEPEQQAQRQLPATAAQETTAAAASSSSQALREQKEEEEAEEGQNDHMDTDPPPPPPPPTASIEAASAPAAAEQQQQEQEQTRQPAAAATASAPAAAAADGAVVAPPPPTTTPASPPLPRRPTAIAPGPRAARLQKVLDDSLRHTLGKVGYDNFATCFPTVAARAPATLKAAQRQMVDRLGMLCKKEFDSILESRNVVAKLNELEGLVGEAERRRDEAGPVDEADLPVPPHLLPADAVLAAHLRPHLAASQSQLNARLQTTQAHNARLWADVGRQRADLAALAAALDRRVGDLDDARAMLDDARVDALARETRDVEAELAANPPHGRQGS